MLSRVVAWMRVGYPTSIPTRDYLPLMALLRRRLTQQEVKKVTKSLIRAGWAPVDDIDIGVGITMVTDQLPSPSDIQRVRARLTKKGWATAGER